MFNKSTVIYNNDAPDGILLPIHSGILAVKLTNKKYSSKEIADTINLALSEISPCNGMSNFTKVCSTSNGTIPFKATVSPDGRILICQSFYELAISGSNSYLDYIFSFDIIEEGKTCKVKAGYVLSDIPKGCAMHNIGEAKTEAEIKSIVDAKNARSINFQYDIIEYTPKAIIKKISDYTSQGISYAFAPTLTGPLSNNSFTSGKEDTSIPSALWVTNQYINKSQYAEFWATVSLNEEDIKAVIGKDKTILKVLSVSASIKSVIPLINEWAHLSSTVPSRQAALFTSTFPFAFTVSAYCISASVASLLSLFSSRIRLSSNFLYRNPKTIRIKKSINKFVNDFI